MNYHRCGRSLAALILGLIGFCVQTVAQDGLSNRGLLDSQQSSEQYDLIQQNSGQFNQGPAVHTANLTTPARMLNRASVNKSQRQIQVKIRYLIVDDENRSAIYQKLTPGSVKTETQRLPEVDAPAEFVSNGDHQHSDRSIATTSCVSTALFDSETRGVILRQVAQSNGAIVSGTPSIILLDGMDGQVDEIVQRPFVVGLGAAPESATNDGQASATPAIQVVDDGISLRVRATMRDDGSLQLASELISKKIIGVEQTKVFGLANDAVLQRPIHQVEKAVVAAEMKFGQTLMIDPYISSELEVRVQRSVPLIGKIPYINRSFKNTASATTAANWVVLIEPQLQPSTVQQVSATENQ